jgi:amphi-Trp domain-containing protein
MPQSGNGEAADPAQDKPPARSAASASKSTSTSTPSKTAATGTSKKSKAKSGNGATEARAKSKSAESAAPEKSAQSDDRAAAEKKDKKETKKLMKRLEKAAQGDKKKDEKKKSKDKKKSKSSGVASAEIDYESRMNREEAVAYFEALVAGLKQGSVRFKQGEETVVIRPSDLVDVEIKARSSGRKEKVRFEISWLSEYSGKMSITSG